MTGDKIASAARACIGTPFRPQGRLAGVGLDCIGLAAVAVRAGGTDVEPPSDYDLSGDCGSRLADALEALRSEEHTSELQSLMRISYAVFCLKKKKTLICAHITS